MTGQPRSARPRSRQLWARLRASPALPAKALRFVCVGVGNGLVFWAVTAVLVEHFAVAPVAAAVAGYAVCIPIGFLGHRQFSFRSAGDQRAEAMRFAFTQAVNIAATALIMGLVVNAWRAAYSWGVVWTVIVAPVINFIVANAWIFRQQKGPFNCNGHSR